MVKSAEMASEIQHIFTGKEQLRRHLLAVDAGIRTGLALFDDRGGLIWYRSHNMGSKTTLRKAIFNILNAIPELEFLVIEGGGPLAESWAKEADRRGISIIRTDAGVWRHDLLYDRQQRSGIQAKQTAIKKAKAFIRNSSAPSANPPTHDAAEAILAGIWGCYKTGWISNLPDLNQ